MKLTAGKNSGTFIFKEEKIKKSVPKKIRCNDVLTHVVGLIMAKRVMRKLIGPFPSRRRPATDQGLPHIRVYQKSVPPEVRRRRKKNVILIETGRISAAKQRVLGGKTLK